MTTEELFNEICRILKEKGRVPDILDYGLATHSPVPVTNCEFDLKSNLDYGGNEGIYLDIWTEYSAEEKKCINRLGTFKTLNTNHEAMHTMAGLLADFIIEEYARALEQYRRRMRQKMQCTRLYAGQREYQQETALI